MTVPPCNASTSDLNARGAVATPYNLYILALDVDPTVGLSGARFGIDYDDCMSGQIRDGLRVISWQTNADAQIFLRNGNGDSWPAPGAGNMLIFQEPIGTVPHPEDANGRSTAVLGCFYVYAYGDAMFEIVPTVKSGPAGSVREGGMEPELSAIQVTDSARRLSFITYPDNTGTVVFGDGRTGRNPCAEWIQENTATHVALESPAITLSASTPNPAGSRVSWSLTSTKDRSVDVHLYDVAGRLVRTWGAIRLTRGRYDLTWDGLDNAGRAAPSGKYFLRVDGDDGYLAVRSAVLLR